VIWKLTTSQTTILFPLYYDGNNLNYRNSENEDDFLHRRATNVSAQGVDVPNLIKIDSAVAALRMREKTRYRMGFLLTYLSIRSSPRLQAAFLARF